MKEKRELTVLMVFAALLTLGVVLCNVLTAPMPSEMTITYPSNTTGTQSTSSPSDSGASSEQASSTAELAQTESSEESNTGKININTADAEELCRLPGIGEVLAGRIIGYRQEYGPYTDPAQLKNIKGIGDKVYEKLLPMITW